MLQLTTKEFDIYKNYIFEKITENFKHIGIIDMDYLKTVTNIEYEVSEITGLIYPNIKFRDSFEKLETLSKIELNDKANDLLDKYKIETIQIPIIEIIKKDSTIITPYDNVDIKNYVTKKLDIYHSIVKEINTKILTNDDESEFEFLDENQNIKTYLLPINYENEKSLDLYAHYRDTKNQIRNIVDTIKPIDAEKLHDLVIEHYKSI